MKKHILLSGLACLLLGITFMSCSTNAPISDDYVLQVKKTGLRQGVFVRRYQLTGDYGSHTTFTADMLKTYIANVLQPDYVLIQHAYDLGLDKTPEIAQKMTDYRVNLLADNHPIKYAQLTILKKDLEEFYDKKSKVYDVDIIQAASFRDADSLYKLLQSGQKLERPRFLMEGTLPNFYHDPSLVYGEGLHPELLSELVKMQQGDISQPIYAASIWTILKLNKIEKNKNLPPFEESEQTLLAQAQAFFKYEQHKQLVEDLKIAHHAAYRTELYQAILQAFAIVNNRGAIDQKKIADDVLNSTFLTIGNIHVSVAEFVSAFNQASQFKQLHSLARQDLEQFANEYVAQYCLYLDALDKGVEDDVLIQDKLQNKEHRMLLSAYLTDEVMNKINISDKELRAHYAANPNKWKGDFKSVALNVKGDLRSEKLKERKNAIIQKLEKKYTIQYNDALLQTIAEELTDLKKSEQQ